MASTLCTTQIVMPAATVEMKGEAPTTARLSIAPSIITIILSNADFDPNDLMPEIRMSMSAMKNIKNDLAVISPASRLPPVPKIRSRNSSIVFLKNYIKIQALIYNLYFGMYPGASVISF